MNTQPETEGWILIQPETVANTLVLFDEAMDRMDAETAAVANVGDAEWWIRYRIEHVFAQREQFEDACSGGEAGYAQHVIGQFEEVDA